MKSVVAGKMNCRRIGLRDMAKFVDVLINCLSDQSIQGPDWAE